MEKEFLTEWYKRRNDRDYNNLFMNNLVMKTPKSKERVKANIYDDYDETVRYALDHNQKTRKKFYPIPDFYATDSKVGDLKRLLEYKFENSQTELKRKFYDAIRDVKTEIDTKQFNMSKHLKELKNIAQREREEKEHLKMEVDRLTK